MLRPPLKSALHAAVRVMNEAVESRCSACVDGHLQGVEGQVGSQRRRDLPADDDAGEHVEHEGHVDDARPGRAVGEVTHPQLIGTRGVEVPVDEVRGADVVGIGLGGEALLRAARPPDALVAHEAGHLVAPHIMAARRAALVSLRRP